MWDTFRPLRGSRPSGGTSTSPSTPCPGTRTRPAWRPEVFEEARLYSPVTRGEEGVVVHLGDDHPGANDPVYRARRAQIAEAALDWTPRARARSRLHPRGAGGLAHGLPRLGPSTSATPAAPSATPRSACRGTTSRSSGRSGARLRPLTGFRYARCPPPGLCRSVITGSLADRVFHSTQYIRHPGGAALPGARPDPRGDRPRQPARLAGVRGAEPAGGARPARRCETEAGLKFLADIFWFTIEFGVLYEDGELRAYGAGICRATARSRSSVDGDQGRSTSSRWERSSTTSPSTSRSSTRRSPWAIWWRTGRLLGGFDDDSPERLKAEPPGPA